MDPMYQGDRCVFGCDEDPLGLFYLPSGCFCHAETLQWLCPQHWEKSAAIAGIYSVFYWGA